ncbi:hypothetical protein [Pelosinus sp. sgz500959]|uniref:hypothetical protein n=1 Tax=Pelosinus sp. sgz500959 TaxID=3242472 RepID=UPI0036702928
MEKYQEITEYSTKNLIGMGFIITVLVSWLAIERESYVGGNVSYLGIGYILFFSCILIWRYAVRYTYILTDQELRITSRFLWFSPTIVIPLNSIETYSKRYVKQYFKRAGMSRYIYRYSSGDGRTIRIVIFKDKGKLSAVLFKVSDQFMEKIRFKIGEGS